MDALEFAGRFNRAKDILKGDSQGNKERNAEFIFSINT